MLNERERELINAGVDGELAAADRQAHDDLLAASAEARALRGELLKLAALIEALPEQAPPADLAGRILQQAEPRSATVVPLRPRWRRAQLPLAFAAGLLVALVVPRLAPLGVEPAEQARMSGTLAPAAESRGGAAHEIDVPGLSGRVALGQRGEARSLEFDLRGDTPLEIEVGLAGTGHAFGGVVLDEAGRDRGPGRIEVTGGTVRVVGDGAAAFGLLLPATAAGAENLSIAIRSGGAVRYEATFED
jgi:hypothetical protein